MEKDKIFQVTFKKVIVGDKRAYELLSFSGPRCYQVPKAYLDGMTGAYVAQSSLLGDSITMWDNRFSIWHAQLFVGSTVSEALFQQVKQALSLASAELELYRERVAKLESGWNGQETLEF